MVHELAARSRASPRHARLGPPECVQNAPVLPAHHGNCRTAGATIAVDHHLTVLPSPSSSAPATSSPGPTAPPTPSASTSSTAFFSPPPRRRLQPRLHHPGRRRRPCRLSRAHQGRPRSARPSPASARPHPRRWTSPISALQPGERLQVGKDGDQGREMKGPRSSIFPDQPLLTPRRDFLETCVYRRL